MLTEHHFLHLNMFFIESCVFFISCLILRSSVFYSVFYFGAFWGLTGRGCGFFMGAVGACLGRLLGWIAGPAVGHLAGAGLRTSWWMTCWWVAGCIRSGLR